MKTLGLAAVLAAVTAAPLAAQDVGLAIGTTPGSAVVQTLDGQAVDLAERYVGKKPVLFEFWATWCPICRSLEPRMRAAHQRFGDRVDFVAVGVGVNETPASIRRHLARHPLPLTVYFDATGAAVRTFEAPATSYIVVLDAQGRVVYTGSGEGQDIEAAVERALR